MTAQGNPASERVAAVTNELGHPGRRRASTGLGVEGMRPLSDPGVLKRMAPFTVAAVIVVVLALLPPTSPHPSALTAASVFLALLVVAALAIPWARLPDWSQAALPLVSFVAVALMRHSGGGATSGYSPLVMLIILWMAIYGTRPQFMLAIAGTAATFLGPLILVGPPMYPSIGWRESVVWVVIGLLAGSAIQSLVEQVRHRAADVVALGAITRALTTGSDPRPELCATAQHVTGAAFVVLYEQHVDGTLVATAGSEGVDLTSMGTDPRTELSTTAQVWRNGKRIYISDTATDPRASMRLAEHTGAGAVLFQPVTRDGCITAVLVIGFHEKRQQVPEGEMFLVELLAAEIGAGIDRADLVELLATQSRTDPLTGAANRRSWDEGMDRELARARRTGSPLTVGLIDLDHFKAYNDTHGHVAGDVLLLDLVTAIRAELRTGDLIARWGGEEFAIALPDCDLDQAQMLCSRLLLVVPQGQTVSIGLTMATTAATGTATTTATATVQDTPRSMVERADLALYAAKNSGRNQVRSQPSPTPTGGVHDRTEPTPTRAHAET